MEKLFDEYGAYRFMGFTGKNGDWYLIGSEIIEKHTKVPYESPISKGILRTIDTFKNSKGELIEKERWKIMEYASKKLITPIETSKITYNTVAKKQRPM